MFDAAGFHHVERPDEGVDYGANCLSMDGGEQLHFFKSSVRVENCSKAAPLSNQNSFGPFRKGGHRVEDVMQLVGVGVFLPAAATAPCRLVTWTAVGVDGI